MAYDNICKYLAEKYPEQFVRWLVAEEPSTIQVLKTELSAEPIRADSLILLQLDDQILHLEFQTLPHSQPPIPFRMLQYYVRLQSLYWGQRIRQFVIFLKQTSSAAVYTDHYQNEHTWHRYQVIRIWEENPEPLLANPALLPLAPLAQSDSPQTLLEQAATQVAMIEESERQREILACTEVLAGLRFDETLINQLFSEDLMRESVIYQKILREGRQLGRQEGRQLGRQEGRQEGELALLTRLISRRFGAIAPQTQERLQRLSIAQLEELGERLFDFSEERELTVWLEQQE